MCIAVLWLFARVAVIYAWIRGRINASLSTQFDILNFYYIYAIRDDEYSFLSVVWGVDVATVYHYTM